MPATVLGQGWYSQGRFALSVPFGGDDDAPGDGDEGHLCGLSGLPHGLVLALEALDGSDGADGCEVESGAHARSLSTDVRLSGCKSLWLGWGQAAERLADGRTYQHQGADALGNLLALLLRHDGNQ